MARVTVEDCVKYVPNRFELVIMAARRARQLSRGSEPLVPMERDKFTVLALREIGEGKVSEESLLIEESRLVAVAPEREEDEEFHEEARLLMEEETHVAGVVEEEAEEFDEADEGEDGALLMGADGMDGVGDEEEM